MRGLLGDLLERLLSSSWRMDPCPDSKGGLCSCAGLTSDERCPSMLYALVASQVSRLEGNPFFEGSKKITSFTPYSLFLRYTRSCFATTARSTQALARLSLLLGSLKRSPSLLLSRTNTMSSSSASQPYAREQQIAIAAVLKASLLAQKIQQELVGSGGVQKKDKSPVTGQFSLLSLEPWYHRRRRGELRLGYDCMGTEGRGLGCGGRLGAAEGRGANIVESLWTLQSWRNRARHRRATAMWRPENKAAMHLPFQRQGF